MGGPCVDFGEQKIDIDDLWKNADITNEQGTSAIVRAIDKHAGRDGSVFPKLTGNLEAKNNVAKQIFNEIMGDTSKTTTVKDTPFVLSRYGQPVIDIVASDGRGLRFGKNGEFIGVLEP